MVRPYRLTCSWWPALSVIVKRVRIFENQLWSHGPGYQVDRQSNKEQYCDGGGPPALPCRDFLTDLGLVIKFHSHFNASHELPRYQAGVKPKKLRVLARKGL